MGNQYYLTKIKEYYDLLQCLQELLESQHVLLNRLSVLEKKIELMEMFNKKKNELNT